MHPSWRFAWEHEAELRAFVSARSFAQISIAIDGEVQCAHAPLSVCSDGGFRFHLAGAIAGLRSAGHGDVATFIEQA